MSDPFDSLRIRPGEPGDHARVSKDWCISAARSTFARYLTPRPDWGIKASQLYWQWQPEIVRHLLKNAELWIACWAEAPTSIVGWAVMEGGDEPVVHYVDVLPAYRRHGVAKRLLAPAFDRPRVTYTYMTPALKSLSIPPGWTFDPRPALVVPQPTKKAA